MTETNEYSHSAPLAGDERQLPPAVLVDSRASFDQMMAVLREQPAVALDTESDSLYRYFYRVCLIQISLPEMDYLVDPLRVPDLEPLGALLADPAYQKVFHAAENDIITLKRDFGFSFANLFDTMVAARILGWRQVGLAALLEKHFGVTLDKRTQLTDWGQRPLSKTQLSYARFDSHYLLPLRDLLTAELQRRGRWREAQESMASLAAVTYVEKPFDPDGFWRIKGARDLQPGELAVLRELYLWRDGQARAANRPPFKVIGDDSLLRLSQRQPRHLSDLRLSERQVDHYGDSLLAVIRRAQDAPPPQPPARQRGGNGRPDPSVTARFDRLRTWRANRAAERGVEADVVMTNDALMAIARTAPPTLEELASLEILGPWKLEEYGAELLEVLAA
jgi:ribonuclease D